MLTINKRGQISEYPSNLNYTESDINRLQIRVINAAKFVNRL